MVLIHLLADHDSSCLFKEYDRKIVLHEEDWQDENQQCTLMTFNDVSL